MSRIEPMDSVGEMMPIPKWIQVEAHRFWDSQDTQRSKRVPLAQIKASLLETNEADRLPNTLVIELLQKSDENEDGYLDYDEYMKFAELAAASSRGRDRFSRAAMTVIPRNERTAAKRSYLNQYSCCPPPLFMIIATLSEVGAFIYYLFDMGEKMGAGGPAPIYSPLIYNPERRYEAWRFVSYALIHSGYMHLVNNLLVQSFLGIPLELVHGWWRVGIIYLSGVFFGSLAQSVQSPKSYLAGASAGVFSVEYAHLGNILLNWNQMEFRWVQLVFILVLSSADIGLAVYDIYFSENPSTTGHLAHLGGAIAGITVGIYILRNLEKKKWEKYCWWIALVLYIILAVTGVTLNITLPMPSYFPADDTAPIGQARIDYFNNKG